MKLIYFTAKKLQNQSADSLYIENLARAFNVLLGNNFLLVVASKNKEQLLDLRALNLNLKVWGKSFLLYFWAPYVYYFIWTPFFIVKNKLYGDDCVFFLGDTKLIFILLFWKKLFRSKYKICSDWHMYYNNWPSRLAAKYSDYLISTSIKLKRLVAKSNPRINSENFIVAYGGVDLTKFNLSISKDELRNKLELPTDKKLVGYVGFFKTMNMSKGLDVMIDSLRYSDDTIRMVFVGGTAEQINEYSKLAEELKVTDKCIFLGKKEFEQVVLYEKAMDILVIPYPDQPHFRNFGFPMKTYEYMASQVPILYSQLDLVEEVLADCAYGFKPDDSKDLAVNIDLILAHYSEARRKALRAYEQVSNYTWEKRANNIINFLIS